MPALIAIVEDDPDQLKNYADALTKRGHKVTGYGSREEATVGLGRQPPDLAILDVVLGDDFDGGFQLCRELLLTTPTLPIIFLTSRIDEIDQIFGLRLGAWDYQTKPVSLSILVERVSALLHVIQIRKDPTPTTHVIEVGDLRVDKKRVQVTWKEQPVYLTVTECLLLSVIAGKQGGASHYDELAKATRQSLVTNNTVNTHIRHIRSKFQKIDPSFECIDNVYGAGYRWISNPKIGG